MVELNNSVTLVTLQFSFSNWFAVPKSVENFDRETIEKRVERKSWSSGSQVIEATESCSIVEYLEDLKAAGYELVYAKR